MFDPRIDFQLESRVFAISESKEYGPSLDLYFNLTVEKNRQVVLSDLAVLEKWRSGSGINGDHLLKSGRLHVQIGPSWDSRLASVSLTESNEFDIRLWISDESFQTLKAEDLHQKQVTLVLTFQNGSKAIADMPSHGGDQILTAWDTSIEPVLQPSSFKINFADSQR